MRGHGLGGLFASLFRRSIPFLKSVGLYTARNLKSIGMESLREMSEGDKPKDVLKKTARRFTGRVLSDLGSKLQGRGCKRKRAKTSKIPRKTKRQKTCKAGEKRRTKSTRKKRRTSKTTKLSKKTTSHTFLY